ncbi:YitT family protein, partial [Phocaeicola dorei]
LGIPVGKSLLALDAFVLTISLSYLDIKHMIYTLLASFVLARITDSIQAGSYAARGLFIISDKYEQIAKMIDVQLDRGYTFINAEGGFDRS